MAEEATIITENDNETKLPEVKSSNVSLDAPVEALNNSTNQTREELLEEVLQTRNQLQFLATNITRTKKSCTKLKSENDYLQDYVGSLMSSGLVDKK